MLMRFQTKSPFITIPFWLMLFFLTRDIQTLIPASRKRLRTQLSMLISYAIFYVAHFVVDFTKGIIDFGDNALFCEQWGYIAAAFVCLNVKANECQWQQLH